MMEPKIRKLLGEGEELTIEFKRCYDKLPLSVYETLGAHSRTATTETSC
jgi:hypothetical protein